MILLRKICKIFQYFPITHEQKVLYCHDILGSYDRAPQIWHTLWVRIAISNFCEYRWGILLDPRLGELLQMLPLMTQIPLSSKTLEQLSPRTKTVRQLYVFNSLSIPGAKQDLWVPTTQWHKHIQTMSRKHWLILYKISFRRSFPCYICGNYLILCDINVGILVV